MMAAHQTPLPTPVLFLIFNRPELTFRTFERIRAAKPRQLFIAGDGPRSDHRDDYEAVARARDVTDMVDWDCNVKTLFRENNLGCGRAVSSAIDWAFETVDELIILEDDCLPSASFFPFCAELLEKYRDDQRIVVVSGDNFQQGPPRTQYSYYFSRFNHCWGWATWKRAWRHFEFEMKLWPEIRDGGWLSDILRDERAIAYWIRKFDAVYHGEIDTWDYQWTFSCWIQGALTVLPRVNLVQNIGFTDDATHTCGGIEHSVPTHDFARQLIHPPYVIRDERADDWTQLRTFGFGHVSLWDRLRLLLARWLS